MPQTHQRTVIDRVMARMHLFYGWLIVAASAVAFFIGNGSRVAAFPVFLKPITKEFGWSRTQFSGASALGSMEGAAEGLVVGPLTDRFGPRKIVIVGFIIGAAGFILMRYMSSLGMFYFIFVGLISLGLGATALPCQTATVCWFSRRRSRALAFLTTGFALGGTILTPAVSWLVGRFDWRGATVIVGIAILVAGVAAGSLLRHRPEQYGYLPDGDSSPATVAKGTQTGRTTKQLQKVEIDFTLREAMRTRSFWLFAGANMLNSAAVSTIMLHAVAAIQDGGISAQAAANFVGMAFFFGLLGRLMWGTLGDYVPKRILLAIAAIVMSSGILVLTRFTSAWQVYFYVVLYGVGQGVVPVQFALRGEYWGRKAFATIGGVLQAIASIGGVLGPVYAGWAYDTGGSYKTAFYVITTLAVASAMLFFLCTAPPPPKRASMTE